MMHEEEKHRDVFEVYYALGDKRSIKKLHQHCTETAPEYAPSLRTLKNWSSWFNWQEKVQIRDTEIARGVEAKVTKSNIDARAKALKEIQNLTGLVWAAIETAFPKDKKTGKRITMIRVETPRDLSNLVNSLLRAEEVKLKVAGEPEKHEHTGGLKIVFEDVETNGNKTNKKDKEIPNVSE